MPFIKGIDDHGKAHWLMDGGHWGDSIHAHNFTPAKAQFELNEIRKRNRYLDSDARIEPEITHVKS